MELALDRGMHGRSDGGDWPAESSDTNLTVLLVSGSDGNRNHIDTVLTKGGFACLHAWDPTGARSLLERGRFGLIVIEGRLNGVSATAFCQKIAPHSKCPVIVIDDGDDVMDRVIALETGADDYLSNPLHDREMLARARALTRRAQSAHEDRGPSHGAPNWSLNLISRQIACPGRGRVVVLTPGEQSLLAAFLNQPGIPLTNEVAARHVASRRLSRDMFRVAVVRLRRKIAFAGLGEDAIVTLRGGGYVFDSDLAASCVIRQGYA